MGILLGIVFIIILLALLGVDMWFFLVAGAAVVTFAAAMTGVFFLVCCIILLRSRRCTGEFTRFAEGKRFESAEYIIDGVPHENVFPAEFVMRERLYRPGIPVKLRLTRSGRVFDRNAFITTLIGLPLSIATACAFGTGLFLLIGAA